MAVSVPCSGLIFLYMAITGCEKWYIGFPSPSWGLFFYAKTL